MPKSPFSCATGNYSRPELVQLAKQLGIPHSKRTKEELCAEISAEMIAESGGDDSTFDFRRVRIDDDALLDELIGYSDTLKQQYQQEKRGRRQNVRN